MGIWSRGVSEWEEVGGDIVMLMDVQKDRIQNH
jgi:hypothetical protein